MKTSTNQPNIHLLFGSLAGPMLLLSAAAALVPPPRARADDTVNYRDTVHYYEAISPSAKPVPGRRLAPRLGFVHWVRRSRGLTAPARVAVIGRSADVVAAPRTSAGDDHPIVFSAAEATGAAQGQTVNRATNDLN